MAATAASLMLMQRQAITAAVLTAKQQKNVTWEDLGILIERSPIFVASVCLGENSFESREAQILGEYLELSPNVVAGLCLPPLKAQTPGDVLIQDPFIYRLNEILLVYGLPLKEVVQEKFGDGIMSAIDFTMDVEKESNPNGDRVKVTLSGKWLPYKKW